MRAAGACLKTRGNWGLGGIVNITWCGVRRWGLVCVHVAWRSCPGSLVSGATFDGEFVGLVCRGVNIQRMNASQAGKFGGEFLHGVRVCLGQV
jgi:hypothetical protein